jgi:hypothetical protein
MPAQCATASQLENTAVSRRMSDTLHVIMLELETGLV